jgi:hypothetical protein
VSECDRMRGRAAFHPGGSKIMEIEKSDGDGITIAARRSRGRPKNLQAASKLHISIPENLTKRLVVLQKDTHASSLTEVIKAALLLYAAAVEEHKAGGHV